MAANGTRSALILGVTGQDGSHLAADLLSQGYAVYGGYRRGHSSKLWRLEELKILDRVQLINVNVNEPHQVLEALTTLKPAEVYHLAGESFVADSFEQPRSVIEANVIGALNVLEAIRIVAPGTRLFYAASAEMFGASLDGRLLDEMSPFRPTNPYGISKLAGHQLVGMYRERHKIHAVCGIMFNHEGPLRARNFVTRKITYNLARLKLAGGKPMQLGALTSARDWGFAADYAALMPRLLALDTLDDFVVATGEKTTVKEFVSLAAHAAGFDPVFEGDGASTTCRDRKSGLPLVEVSAKYFRPFDTPPLIGNPAKVKAATGFKGSRDVGAIAEAMIAADILRRKNGMTHV